jgi:hypothetical protein
VARSGYFDALPLEIGRGRVDQRLVGNDEQVVAILCGNVSKLEANTRRSAGNDREFVGHG